jgi:hypothetical protein
LKKKAFCADASLDVETLVAEFLEAYYGGGEAAAGLSKYIHLMATAFATGNRSVDFTGRPYKNAKAAKHLGKEKRVLCATFI